MEGARFRFMFYFNGRKLDLGIRKGGFDDMRDHYLPVLLGLRSFGSDSSQYLVHSGLSQENRGVRVWGFGVG